MELFDPVIAMPSGLRISKRWRIPSMIGMLYFVLFMILFLENGLLPAGLLTG